MQSGSPIVLLSAPAAHALVVDLIGDLDPELTRSLSEALDRFDGGDGSPIVVRLKHLADVRPTGVAALGSVLSAQRRRGRNVSVASESGRIRAVLRTAGVPVTPRIESERGAGLRHVMIVHNGKPTRDCA